MMTGSAGPTVASSGRLRWVFLDGRHFAGRFDRLLNLFLRRIHFSLNGSHFRIDRVPHIGHRLLERSQRVSKSLSQMLHIGRRDPVTGLPGLGLQGRLLRLNTRHGILVHDR